VLEGVIPLETFPLVEWHYGELADVPSFTMLKMQICVTSLQCVKKGYQPRTNIVKEEKGYLVTESYSILGRWRNHFSRLFHVHGFSNVRQIQTHRGEGG